MYSLLHTAKSSSDSVLYALDKTELRNKSDNRNIYFIHIILFGNDEWKCDLDIITNDI